MRRKVLFVLGTAMILGLLGLVVFGSALAQPLRQTASPPSAGQLDTASSCHLDAGTDGHMLGAAAGALGLTEDALRAEIQSGKSLKDIAKARGLDEQQLAAALSSALRQLVKKHVDDGHLSQADADAMLQHMEQVGFDHMAGATGADTHEDMMNGMMGGGSPGMMEQQNPDPTLDGDGGGSCHGREQNTSRSL